MDFPGEKLILRLWDTLAVSGVSTLLKPWQIKREGSAQIEIRRLELLSMAQAEVDAEKIKEGSKSLQDFMPRNNLLLQKHSNDSIDDRVEPVLIVSEVFEKTIEQMIGDNVRKNINISKAVFYAEDHLKHKASPGSDTAVEKDWVHRWRELVGNVSSEEMQRLWGRLLAEEVESPGSFSLRCLEFIKNLSRQEAHLIERLAKISFRKNLWGDDDVLEEFGFSFDDLMELQGLGVISGVEAESLMSSVPSIDSEEGRFRTLIVLSSKKLLVIQSDDAKSVDYKSYLVTRLGQQLLRLSSVDPEIEFFKKFSKMLMLEGYSVILVSYVEGDDGYFEWEEEEDELKLGL
ncbi:DUF2806 domain-containing protein [Pseudomonas sp. IT-P171]|uniref:DUF2806 domain-containing protein n=1 Tax=Pseudomonas sp. IT-P171 TaxID=3026453 RepID=UPI0039E04BF6